MTLFTTILPLLLTRRADFSPVQIAEDGWTLAHVCVAPHPHPDSVVMCLT